MNAAKTIRISGKCSDLFEAYVYDADGNKLFRYEGYVPEFLGGIISN